MFLAAHMRIHISCVSLILLKAASATTIGWVWGSGDITAHQKVRGTLTQRFPNHGFIELSVATHELKIALVKRPLAEDYPTFLPFCSKLLPMAVNEAYDTVTRRKINELQSVVVEIEFGEYAHRACVCYVGLMVGMGVDIINEYTAPADDFINIDDFCMQHHSELHLDGKFSRNAAPKLPPTDPGYSHALNSASRVIVGQNQYSSMDELRMMREAGLLAGL